MRRFAAVFLIALAADTAAAQVPRKAEPPPPPALEAAPPPYDPPLLRLAEVLGTLAYMRDLCGAGDGGEYRSRMAALIEAETSAGPRRERLAGFFNRGFRAYELMHRTCTPVSREVESRALAEAGRLAREIGNRFGGT